MEILTPKVYPHEGSRSRITDNSWMSTGGRCLPDRLEEETEGMIEAR